MHIQNKIEALRGIESACIKIRDHEKVKDDTSVDKKSVFRNC